MAGDYGSGTYGSGTYGDPTGTPPPSEPPVGTGTTLYVTGQSKYVEFAVGRVLVNGQVLYITEPFRIANEQLVGASGGDYGDYYVYVRWNRKPMEAYYIRNYEFGLRSTSAGGVVPTEMPDEFFVGKIEKRQDGNGDTVLTAFPYNRGKRIIDSRHISDLAIKPTHISTLSTDNFTFPGYISVSGSTVKVLAGSGTPEGVVTAPIGSIYQRTNGGTGTAAYIKETGAGNTGWVALGSGGGGPAVTTGTYTPTLATSGTAPSLGNGTLTGDYYRIGDLVYCNAEFTVGSTTTLGTGDIRLGLPIARTLTQTILGVGLIVMFSGVRYTLVSQIQPSVTNYVRLVRDTGVVTATSPATFVTGDVIRFSMSYQVQ